MHVNRGRHEEELRRWEEEEYYRRVEEERFWEEERHRRYEAEFFEWGAPGRMGPPRGPPGPMGPRPLMEGVGDMGPVRIHYGYVNTCREKFMCRSCSSVELSEWKNLEIL